MQVGPWWFASAVAFVGIVVGIAAKWIIDLLAERSRREREDRLRFLHDKREAYARLLAAGRRVRLHHARAGQDGSEAELKARAKARNDVADTYAVIAIIGPKQIVDTARAYFNLLMRNDSGEDEVRRAQNTFRLAARIDLGTDPDRVLVLPLHRSRRRRALAALDRPVRRGTRAPAGP